MALIDVWLAAGQSNMQGIGTGVDAPDTDPALALEWDGGPGLVQVDDPHSSSGEYRAQTGSSLPSFVNVITAATARPSLIVRAAVGGTALLAVNAQTKGDWSPTGTRFGDSVTRTLDAITDAEALGHTIAGVHVLWLQGGRDVLGGQDLNLYQQAYQDLVGRWRTDLSRPSLKVYAIRIGTTSTGDVGPEHQEVRDAQDAAAAAQEGMEMAFTETITFPDRGWMKFDGIHYSQPGLNYMGDQVGRFVATDLGFTPPPEPLPELTTSQIAHRLLRM